MHGGFAYRFIGEFSWADNKLDKTYGRRDDREAEQMEVQLDELEECSNDSVVPAEDLKAVIATVALNSATKLYVVYPETMVRTAELCFFKPVPGVWWKIPGSTQ